VDITEKGSLEAYKPDSVTPALSGGMGQNSPNLLWEACGMLPVTFENVMKEIKAEKNNSFYYYSDISHS
jgi:hypothetical protein